MKSCFCLYVRVYRYHTAVTIALGKNLDSIIVQDEKTAKDCIQARSLALLSHLTRLNSFSLHSFYFNAERNSI